LGSRFRAWFVPSVFFVILTGVGIILSQNRHWLDLLYEPKAIYVKIGGNIRNPGIYKMRNGDRLEDLIEKAGGLKDTEKSIGYDPLTPLEDGGVIWLGDR